MRACDSTPLPSPVTDIYPFYAPYSHPSVELFAQGLHHYCDTKKSERQEYLESELCQPKSKRISREGSPASPTYSQVYDFDQEIEEPQQEDVTRFVEVHTINNILNNEDEEVETDIN
ncbi:hypothetical protein ABG067_008040, partial [Albugo candida]